MQPHSMHRFTEPAARAGDDLNAGRRRIRGEADAALSLTLLRASLGTARPLPPAGPIPGKVWPTGAGHCGLTGPHKGAGFYFSSPASIPQVVGGSFFGC